MNGPHMQHCTCTGKGTGTRHFLDPNKVSEPCRECGKYSRLPNREERRDWAKTLAREKRRVWARW